jgi:ATP-binding cassette subfamily B protein RaxB
MSNPMNQSSQVSIGPKFTLPKLTFSWRKTTPTILQSEASECGLACLAMVANHFGHELSLRELRISMPASQQGMNLQEIIQNASTLGFSSRALKAELSDLKELQLPAILHWNFKHFVVLTKVSKNHVHIIDPATGKQTLSLNKVDKQFTGIALELRPNDNFSKAKGKGQLSLWEFAKNKVGVKRHVCMLLILSLFIQLFVLASPFYMQTVIDNVLLSNNEHLLIVLALGFALLLLFETCTQWLRDFIMLRFSNVFNLSISSGVFAHLLSLPTAFFQTRHIGDILSRFGSLQHVRDILTQGLLSAFLDGLLGLITLIVMFVYSPKLAFIVLAVVTISVCSAGHCFTQYSSSINKYYSPMPSSKAILCSRCVPSPLSNSAMRTKKPTPIGLTNLSTTPISVFH